VGAAASGAPHGAERTASPARALSESQIARGTVGALAGASTVGLLAAAGPAAPGRAARKYFPIGTKRLQGSLVGRPAGYSPRARSVAPWTAAARSPGAALSPAAKTVRPSASSRRWSASSGLSVPSTTTSAAGAAAGWPAASV